MKSCKRFSIIIGNIIRESIGEDTLTKLKIHLEKRGNRRWNIGDYIVTREVM